MRQCLVLVLLTALLLVGGLQLALAGVPDQGATTFAVTPENTSIKFVGSKAAGKHDGGFKDFTGTIELPADVSKGKIALEIKTESLYTDTPKLTNHLKSPDFFNVNSNPKASFVSTKISEDKGEGKTHTITGDLTLLGKTKSISVPAQITRTGDNLKLTSSFTIDRTEFGMSNFQGKVNNEVKITVNVNASGK